MKKYVVYMDDVAIMSTGSLSVAWLAVYKFGEKPITPKDWRNGVVAAGMAHRLPSQIGKYSVVEGE